MEADLAKRIIFEEQLLHNLEQLEKATSKLMESCGYNNDIKNMRFLSELIKEQISHENAGTAASPLR